MSEEKKKQAMAIAEDYKIMFDAFKEVGFTDEQAMTLLGTMGITVESAAGRTREAELERVRRMAERRALREKEKQLRQGGEVNEDSGR